MEAGRTRKDRLEGLSRFVVLHERCGAGFELEHPEIAGEPLIVVCRGCGARHRHTLSGSAPGLARRAPAAADPGPARPRLRLTEPEAVPGKPAPPPAKPAPPPAEPEPVRPRPRAVERAPKRPRPRTRRWLVGGAAAAGIALVAVLLAESGGGPSSDRGALPQQLIRAVPAEPGAIPPTHSRQPARAPSRSERPERSTNLTSPRPVRVNSAPLTEDTYTLNLPIGWTQAPKGAGLSVEPDQNPAVQVEVYFELAPELDLATMSDKTATLLRTRNRHARISKSTQLQVAGGLPAFRLTATGPGRLETGLVTENGSYRYLLLRTETANAPRRQRVLARRVEASFRPTAG